MSDKTEAIRRQMVEEINSNPSDHEKCEAEYGQVWDTDQLRAEFEVIGFAAPFVAVRRRSDGKKGSLMFQANPRFYFSWTEDAR